MPANDENATWQVEDDADAAGARIYIVGEVGEPSEAEAADWPVKLGWTGAPLRLSRFQVANWRPVELLHERPLPITTVVWQEFLIHRHLGPWWVRGEWYRVRRVAADLGGWPAFLDLAIEGEVPGGDRFEMRSADGDHTLESVHRFGKSDFAARCTCGEELRRNSNLPSTVQRFAKDHLKIAWTKPAATRRRAGDATGVDGG